MPSFVNPKEILSQLELRDSMVAVDFGCGSGGWVLPLAKKLEYGKVFAVDIQEESFSALKSKARMENISNIQTIQANLEEGVSQLNNSFFDLVLMANFLFQVDKKEKVFQEAYRVLKKEGKLLVVDWKENSSLASVGEKVPSGKVKELAENQGFSFEKELEAGDYHYALLFVKE